MKFRLKEEELKAATDKHHKAVRSCLEMEKRATSAEVCSYIYIYIVIYLVY